MSLCKKCLDKNVSPYNYIVDSYSQKYCNECSCETQHITYEIFREKFFDVISQNYIPLSKLPYRASALYDGKDEEGINDLMNIIYTLAINETLKEKLITDALARFDDEIWVIYDDTLEEYEGCNIESGWAEIQDSFKHNLRFFNSDLKKLLDHIFTFITRDGTINEHLLTTLFSGSIFFRGRSFDSFKKLVKDIHDEADNFCLEDKELPSRICKKFGIVPSSLASDQRMTPFGISALYLSTERIACVAEIRALVGQYVGVCQFSNRETLKLLNLNLLTKGLLPNHLEENYREQLDVFIFFKKLMSSISKPKLESGKFDYLISQYFFEYLRVFLGGQVDGIYLKSVQMPTSDNIILFPEVTADGIDSSKDSGKNPIYFILDKDTEYGFSISRVKSIEIETEIDLIKHPRFNCARDWI